MLKKLICLVAALCLLLSLAACAEPNTTQTPETTAETEEPNTLEFLISSNKSNYGVVGLGTYEGTDVVIPSSYKGIPVTVIADDAFSGCSNITSVTLPNTIVKIGNRAFKGCTGLSTITIPASVVTMGYNVFEGTNGLQVKLSTKTVHPKWSEGWSKGVASVTYGTQDLPSDTNNSSQSGSQTGAYSQGLEFAENTLNATDGYIVVGIGTCTDEHVKIPPTYKDQFGREHPVCGIKEEAFKNCTSMKSIVIPDSVSFMGKNILFGCSKLESITTPFVGTDTLTTTPYTLGYLFGQNAFTGAVAVEQHTAHGFNTTLEMNTYYIPSSLKTVNITEELSYGLFSNCTQLTSVTLPKEETRIPDRCFLGCTGLTEITVPATVKYIYDFAFSECTNLKKVTFQEGNYPVLEQIDYGAFDGCSALESISLPSSVKKIDERAFAGCSSLKTITIPASVTEMGNHVFNYNCTALETIYVQKRQSATSEWDSSWNDAPSAQVFYN